MLEIIIISCIVNGPNCKLVEMSTGESKTVPRFKSQKHTKPMSQHAKEYAESSSLHGIKYIAEDGRHPFER